MYFPWPSNTVAEGWYFGDVDIIWKFYHQFHQVVIHTAILALCLWKTDCMQWIKCYHGVGVYHTDTNNPKCSFCLNGEMLSSYNLIQHLLNICWIQWNLLLILRATEVCKVWFLSSRNLQSKKVDTFYFRGAATLYKGGKAGILKRIWDKGVPSRLANNTWRYREG